MYRNKIYDKNNIFILPSFTEGHPQVLDEALSRMRPVIVFEEIKHVKRDRQGVFVCKRDINDLDNTINYIFNNANIGNIYINRNIVGAVVGVQPFGGRGLSGTGPKAGGPNYLLKFANEKSYSYNTTAAGGNATLFMMSENQ